LVFDFFGLCKLKIFYPKSKVLVGERWLLFWFCSFFGFGVLVIGLNVLIDQYGLFGMRTNKNVIPYGDERVSKHLMAMKYIPKYFDSLLIGTSVSGNVQIVSKGNAFYNLSVNGGNVVEVKAIADEYLAVRKPARVVIVVHPYFTAGHDFETAKLKKADWYSALGSVSLFEAYKAQVTSLFKTKKFWVQTDGSYRYGNDTVPLGPVLAKMFFTGDDIFVDPIAFQAFEDIVQRLNTESVPITYLVPPMADNVLKPKLAPIQAYIQRCLKNRKKEDTVIDFINEHRAKLQTIEYLDGVHLTDRGALVLSQIIQDHGLSKPSGL
jgi:hypothetical protein